MSGIDKATLDELPNQIEGLAGAGRTTETVKGNADALAQHLADEAPHHKLRGVELFGFKDVTVTTIAADAITITQAVHRVDTEGGAATDDLSTINGGDQGDLLLLQLNATSRKVTIKHGIGNIQTFDGSDIGLIANSSAILLVKISSTNWFVIGIQGVKRSGDTMTGRLGFMSNTGLNFTTNSDSTTTGDINFSDVQTAPATFRFFRQTNTTGDRNVDIFKGDGTATVSFRFDARRDVFYIKNTQFLSGTGSPEGSMAAPVGSIYLRSDTGELWVKKTGTGNTGWGKVTVA